MQRMPRTRAILLLSATLLLAVVAAEPFDAAGATGAEGAAEATGQAVILADTPQLAAAPEEGSEEAGMAKLARARGILARLADRRRLEEVNRVPELGMIVVDLEGGSVSELREELAGDPRVRAVIADRPAELRLVPNDVGFNTKDPNAPGGDWMQWNLRRSKVFRAWSMSRGQGAEVAVIDTGTDGSHPDLQPRIVAAAKFDPTIGSGPATVDRSGHGTHTAGLACAQSNNGFGIASLGFRCNLFIVKVQLTCSAIASAIVAAANRGSDAINISLGGCGTSLNSALTYAWNSGSVPVVAGANEPTPTPATNYPAQYVQPEGTGPNLSLGRGLVVTAAKHAGSRASFAQRTTGISVAAFGAATDAKSGGQQGIVSTWPSPTLPPIDGDTIVPPVRTEVGGDNRFAYLVGTSMATPQVAGLVALMRAVRPQMPAAEVVRLVKLTASGRGSYLLSQGLGWGIIDARAALGATLHRDVTPPVSWVPWARVVRRGAAARRARRNGRRLVAVRIRRFDPKPPAMPRSGVRVVNAFLTIDGGAFRHLRKTRRRVIYMRARPGRVLRFAARAVDRAGNREAFPRGAGATLRVR